MQQTLKHKYDIYIGYIILQVIQTLVNTNLKQETGIVAIEQDSVVAT